MSDTEREQKIYAEVTNNGIKVIDEDLVKTLENKKLSASLVTGMLDCPARWVSGSILRNFIKEEQDNALTRGSFYHRVMEKFFLLDKEQRVRTLIPGVIEEVLAEEEFIHFKDNKEALEWIQVAINNYYDMGSVPENINIAEFNGRKGLEFFIEGKIPGCERKILGFVDRLIYDNKNNLVIDDWKTGAKSKRYSGTAKEEGWPEARQQILYSQIMSQIEPEKVISKARLIFPVAKDVVNVDIHNKELINKALNDTVKAEKKYNKAVEDNNFEYNPSFLCHWCPLVKACPQSNPVVKRVEKAKLAYESQPSVEELEVGLSLK